MSYCEQCAALLRQNDLLANDRDGYVQLLTDDNNKLRAEVEKLKEQLASPFMDGYETAKEEYRPRLIAAEAENEKLRAALKVAIRQHEEGNKGLAHLTLCEAIYGEQA